MQPIEPAPTRMSPSEPEDPFHVLGRTVLDKYRVERVIGRGAQAVVYRAEHKLLPLKVAIKLLDLAAFQDATTPLQRFQREAQIMARLESHPHTVTVHDVGLLWDGRTPVMAMEHLEGETLRRRLVLNRRTGWRAAFKLCAQAADALAAAHVAGIVHRDVKPDNVFVCSDGRVKVLDFGIARILDAAKDDVLIPARLTGVHMLIGTPSYMSPEQFRNARDLDGRSDVYALGVVLYNLLTARRLWPTSELRKLVMLTMNAEPVDVREHAPEVPAHAAQIVRRALARNRDERPSMTELRATMLAALDVTDPDQPGEGPHANAPQQEIIDVPSVAIALRTEDEITRPLVRAPLVHSAAATLLLPRPTPTVVRSAGATLIRPLPRTPTLFGRVRAGLAAFVALRKR